MGLARDTRMVLSQLRLRLALSDLFVQPKQQHRYYATTVSTAITAARPP